VPVFDSSDSVDSLVELVAQMEEMNIRLTQLEQIVQNLELSQEGWQEARVKQIEDEIDAIERGDVTFEKLNSKTNITAYVG
jgi:exonuclease VII small subunit